MSDFLKQIKFTRFYPSKKMGQNFLTDIKAIDEICANIPDLSKYDCVIEIGPGLGAITTYLTTITKNLICIELDKRLSAQLKQKFSSYKNIQIINNDFLEIDLKKLCKSYKNIIIVANIPYSITTPIILKSLSFKKIHTLYIMVQKEVADKWEYFKTKNRNASTNIINFYFSIKPILTIKNTCFTPIPKVHSKIVLLERKNQINYDHNFYLFIRSFFIAKRKKILNNIPNTINKKDFLSFLISLGYDTNIRAEQLTYNDWERIYKKFK